MALERQGAENLVPLIAREEGEDRLAVRGGVERAASANVDGVADELLGLDHVDEDDGGRIGGERGEERRLAAPPHQRVQRRPRRLHEIAVAARAHRQLERARPESILAPPSLLEIAAGGERPQQRQQAALRRFDADTQILEGQALATGRRQFEDVDDAIGRAVPRTVGHGRQLLRPGVSVHRRSGSYA